MLQSWRAAEDHALSGIAEDRALVFHKVDGGGKARGEHGRSDRLQDGRQRRRRGWRIGLEEDAREDFLRGMAGRKRAAPPRRDVQRAVGHADPGAEPRRVRTEIGDGRDRPTARTSINASRAVGASMGPVTVPGVRVGDSQAWSDELARSSQRIVQRHAAAGSAGSSIETRKVV